ncbi:MAG: LiaF-related protein [Candidatus Krumholzibacteria bacterium]|nr:LiaF-related protein [Candidatus Krumholzibacteria bacterium]
MSSSHVKWAIALIVIGFLALLNNLGVVSVWSFIWRLWPILLIIWGIRQLRRRGTASGKGGMKVFSDTVETTDSPYIRRSSAFGDISVRVEGAEFAGGSASTVFGTVAIDISAVRRVTGYGQLDVHTVFGDVTINAPADLPLEISSSSVFGEVRTGGEKAGGKTWRSPGAAERRLVIRCSQVFGDVTIIRA